MSGKDGRKARAARVVSAAILGRDNQSISVSSRVYIIPPPTIHTIAAAALHLSKLGADGDNIREMLSTLSDLKEAAAALSCFICGNESLTGELSEGTLHEVVNGISVALSLISVEDFMQLSVLVRNVLRLTANPKP